MAPPIRITRGIALDESEIGEQFVRASGPGGQNVNKLASAVRLRFDAAHSLSLPEAVRVRLLRIAGKRATKDGVIVLRAERFRTQERNRADARARLIAMIESAAATPRVRRPTRVPRAAKTERLTHKRQRAETKRGRGRIATDD